jgi:hypothetical protein
MNYTRSINTPTSEEILMESRFANKPIWSWCGSQGGLTGLPLVSIQLKIKSTNRNPTNNLIAGIDSLDVNGGLSYHLAWKQDKKNCP